MADRRTAHYVSGHQVSIIRYQPSHQPSASIILVQLYSYQPGEVCPSVRRESAHLVPFSTVVQSISTGTVVQPWRHRPTKAVLKGDYPTPTMGQDPVAALDPTLGR